MAVTVKALPALTVNGKSLNQRRLKLGNSKLHRILTFDLPAIGSCLNCGDCASACYAMKAQRQYPNVKRWREENFSLAKHYPDILKQMIVNQLAASRLHIVRIHSSGDFFSREYISMWQEVIETFPLMIFYAYTKVDKILDLSGIERLFNFNLIPSYIDGHLNFGPRAHVDKMREVYGSFVCPATEKGNDGITCNKGCTYCFTGKNVVFLQH